MLKIEVTYRPISWLPITRKVISNVPQNWGDINQKQLITIACLYKSRISDIAFLKEMSGLKKGILKRLSNFENYKIMELIDFIGDQKPHHEFIIRRLRLSNHRWLSLSKWSKPGVILFAPEGKLKGITFGQFIFADTYFANYQHSNDEIDLNKFIASLYLKKGEPFDENQIQDHHSKIGKIDKNTREAIVLNYQLMHEWLTLAYPLIFQKREELASTILVNDAAKSPMPEPIESRDSNIWIKVFQNFVGDDILHDEIWAAKPVNTIFSFMTRKYKENARSHKKANKY